MNTVILNSFLTIVKYKSFTQASKILEVTQPTISNHIATLEEMYGVELFHRIGKSVTLTAAGRAFVPVAERLLAAHEESIREMSVFHETCPALRIGLTAQSILYKFSDTLEQLRHEFPELKINVSTIYTLDELTKCIKNRELDFGFINIDTHPLYMQRLRLWEDELYFVAARKLFEKHNCSNNIYDYPFVAYADCNISSKVHGVNVDYSRMNTILVSNDTLTLLCAIADGVGVGLIPKIKVDMYKAYAGDVVIFQAPYNGARAVYSAIYDVEMELTPIKKRFVELLEASRDIM